MSRLCTVLIVACALAAAALAAVPGSPRFRRAVIEDSEEPKKIEICAPKTPCAWSIHSEGDYEQLTNTYCKCGPETDCVVNEFDSAVNAYVYRCRKPKKEDSNN